MSPTPPLDGPALVLMPGPAAYTGEMTLAAAVVTVVILVTMLALRSRRAAGASRSRVAGLGDAVLVAVARPRSTTELARVAAGIAADDHGRVAPVHVLPPDTSPEERGAAGDLLRRAEVLCEELGCEAVSILRAAHSVAEGVLHAAVERDTTLVVVGWPSGHRQGGGLGPPVDRIVDDVPAPVVVARLDGHEWNGVLLVPPAGTAGDGELASLRLAREVGRRLARAHSIDLVLAGHPADERAGSVLEGLAVDDADVGDDGPLGDTAVLTVVPVAPDLRSLDRAISRVRISGDVLLVLSHGPAAEERRPLLPAAQELYRHDSDERDHDGEEV